MNHTITDETVKRYSYDSRSQLGTSLHDFIDAYNFGRWLKTLKGLIPYEYNRCCHVERGGQDARQHLQPVR